MNINLSLNRYQNDPRNNLTFYLDYQMIYPHQDKELGVFYPRSVHNIFQKILIFRKEI